MHEKRRGRQETCPCADELLPQAVRCGGGELNLSLGNYIRNSFGLWADNKALFWSCSKDAGREIKHPDEASGIIIACLALELEKTHKLRSV